MSRYSFSNLSCLEVFSQFYLFSIQLFRSNRLKHFNNYNLFCYINVSNNSLSFYLCQNCHPSIYSEDIKLFRIWVNLDFHAREYSRVDWWKGTIFFDKPNFLCLFVFFANVFVVNLRHCNFPFRSLSIGMRQHHILCRSCIPRIPRENTKLICVFIIWNISAF